MPYFGRPGATRAFAFLPMILLSFHMTEASSNASISGAVYRLVSQNELQQFSDRLTELQYKNVK